MSKDTAVKTFVQPEKWSTERSGANYTVPKS
jgi:hypothetical protein